MSTRPDLQPNPYPPGSPEWQLLENAISAEKLAMAYDADAERYRRQSAEQRQRADAYRAALAKLEAAP